MGYVCMICGEPLEDDDILTICDQYGDMINMIHRWCYDNDDRNYLKTKKKKTTKIRTVKI